MVNAGDTEVNVGVLPWESQYQVNSYHLPAVCSSTLLTLAFPSSTPVRGKSPF